MKQTKNIQGVPKNPLLAMIVLALCITYAFSQGRIAVPYGKPIMIDGFFSENEWEDAKVITIDNHLKLLFKQTREFVYIGIQPQNAGFNGGWVDLYISDEENRTFDLHASQKLGERKLNNGQWEAWEKWWTNGDKWSANFMRIDDKKVNGITSETQLVDNGWEYQIRKNQFSGNIWKIQFDISVVLNEFKKIKYPEGLSTRTDDWLSLILKGEEK